jgi:hypothetical protein
MSEQVARRRRGIVLGVALGVALLVTNWFYPFPSTIYLAAVQWCLHQPVIGLEMILLFGFVWGWFLKDYGVQNLFFHETKWSQLLAGVASALLVAHLLLLSFLVAHFQMFMYSRRPMLIHGLMPTKSLIKMSGEPTPERELAAHLMDFMTVVYPFFLLFLAASAFYTAREGSRLKGVDRWPFVSGLVGGGVSSVALLWVCVIYTGPLHRVTEMVCEGLKFITKKIYVIRFNQIIHILI